MNREYLALQLSIQKEEADAAYYDAIREQMENQKVLIHDIKNHLQILDGLAKSSDCTQVSSYIAKLDATWSPVKSARLCNDSVLNLVLLHYADECKKRKIEFVCDIRENASSFMDAPSITNLYGNLLSNAMESAEQSREKVVEISVVHNFQQENIVVSVINSCDIAPIPGKNGLFQTRKADTEFHGIGLKGIHRVVHKYHGENTMYYDGENSRFHHIIRFPAEQDSWIWICQKTQAGNSACVFFIVTSIVLQYIEKYANGCFSAWFRIKTGPLVPKALISIPIFNTLFVSR